jgi:NAD(P)-dependent dehydrogenase (short-subunit alcohol dehydrogenase family)
MVRATALDFAREGMRVNAINPGFIETELAFSVAAQAPNPAEALAERRAMHPIPRAGKPEEIGAAEVFLASGGSGFVTGQMINVDGGYTIR